jgi:uncharacterized surface protein with fasciclin (FAS1) repeats
MKIISNFKKITLFAFIASMSVSCLSDDDVVPQTVDNTIAGIAARDSNLSSLVQALTRAGLVSTLSGTDKYTVFAPSNAAFTAFLATTPYATINDVPVPALKEILLNHVVSGSVQSSALTTGYIKTLAKGTASTTNTLSMFVDITSGVKLNGVSTVTVKDILATNGVIHKVDKVIGLPTIVTHATANAATFSTLISLLNRTGEPDFVTTLSGTGPFTVFAPTNTAFTDLNTELAPGGIASVAPADITKILQYHVVSPANVLASTLTEGQVVTPILTPAQTFIVQLTGGAKIKDARSRINPITVTDVQCSNGVIHVLSKVLLPTL